MTDNFKDDRAAFEASTPGEWEMDDHGENSPAYIDNGDRASAPIAIVFGGKIVADLLHMNQRENDALIVLMHSTYLPRMARIEELEALPGFTWSIWVPPGCGKHNGKWKRQLHLTCGGAHIGQRWDGHPPPTNDLERYMQKLLDAHE